MEKSRFPVQKPAGRHFTGMSEDLNPQIVPDSSAPDDDRAELFIRLLAENERRLSAYVMALLPHTADAEDVLQETKLAIWRSFEQFEEGTNFGAWARTIAFHRVLDFRKRKARENERLCFSDECCRVLADAIEEGVTRREEQMQSLMDCVARLQPVHRNMLALRYFEHLSIDQVAERVGRSVSATYRALSRIRLTLRDCVARPRPATE